VSAILDERSGRRYTLLEFITEVVGPLAGDDRACCFGFLAGDTQTVSLGDGRTFRRTDDGRPDPSG
jgi:hypothetical protein